MINIIQKQKNILKYVTVFLSVLFALLCLNGNNMNTNAAAIEINFSVYTTPENSSTAKTENIKIVEGDTILDKLPKLTTYYSETDKLSYEFLGYIAKGSSSSYFKITSSTVFNRSDFNSYSIYSIWKLKTWDSKPGNSYSVNGNTVTINSGNLDVIYNKKYSLRDLNGKYNSHYYYPWCENDALTDFVINPAVQITNSRAIPSVSRGTLEINTTNINIPANEILSTSCSVSTDPVSYPSVKSKFGTKSIKINNKEMTWNKVKWNYDSESKTLRIYGTGDMPDSGYPWTPLLNNYGETSNYVNIISIEDGITSIGNNAFTSNRVKNIMIGPNVKKIGSNAFDCSSATSIFNAGTTNQSLGSNAFMNINANSTISYTQANTNFINYINGKAGSYKVANAKGYIEIANGSDWYQNILMSGGVGRFELVSDFSFVGRVSIPEKYCYVNDGYGYTNDKAYSYKTVLKTYENYKLKPLTETYREWPLYNKDYDITGKKEASLINFYGELNGNGHTISNVNYGLFNDNYGTISNLIISNDENTSVCISGIRDAYNKDDGLHDLGYYISPDYIASIASENYGIIDSVEIQGAFSGSRNNYTKLNYGDGDYEYELTDGGFSSGGVVGVNKPTGIIRKSHITGYLRGSSLGGICYENEGSIYGCSNTGTMYGEAYNHSSTRGRYEYVGQPGTLGGICVKNTGTVAQSYGAAQIQGFTYVYRNPDEDEDPSSSDVPHPITNAAALIVTNSGLVNACSTEGYLNLSDGTKVRTDYDGNYSTIYSSLDVNFSKFVTNNSGIINQAFIGSGMRYTRAYGSPSQITYRFTTTGNGNNQAVYSLQNEIYIPEYDSGYHVISSKDYERAVHSCWITAEDYIADTAKQNVRYQSYYNKDMQTRYKVGKFTQHDHNIAHAGTQLKSADAKSGNQALMPGLVPTDWVFSKGKYPRPKDSLKIHVEKVEGRYLGDAIEGTVLDKSKIEFLVYYSDGNVFKTTGASADFNFPYGVYIANVGEMNTVYFKYTDNRLTGSEWPESDYGSFTINARERRPIDILKVEYSGNSITENMNYSPSNVRVTVLFDNNTQSTYLGSSTNVGITTRKDSRGDIDGNGVINQVDYSALKNYLTTNASGSLTDKQKKEADINSDGKIDTGDLSSLTDILSRKVPFDRRTFYVKFSGIDIYKNLTLNSVKRKVNGLIVSSSPEKRKYIEGEDFETKGMVLTVQYDNGEAQTLYFKNGDESFDGLSLGSVDYPIEKMPKGQSKIPITYTENSSTATVWLNISVRQVYLTSISITQQPSILTYYSGESFDSRGMKITAFYDEGVYGDGRLDDFSKQEEIPLAKCIVTGGSKLKDSTNQILIKADTIDASNRDQFGFVVIEKSSIISPNENTLTNGKHATITYTKDTLNKTITGTVVGNNYISVSYTENDVTRNAIQPITIEKKKLTKIDVFQMPHKTTYVEGDLFNPNGLIIKAFFTDGSSEFVYQKTDTNPNGYEIIDGDKPLPIVTELTIKYTTSNSSAVATVPITVTRNDIESITASYTGPKVDLGEKFLPNLVLINVIYKNGSVESFYADKTVSGNPVVTIYKRGTKDKDYQLHDSGDNVEISGSDYINNYTAWYAGLSADFSVTGIKVIPQMDFSGSVAQGRRDASEWTEEFRAVKVKTVYDYINDYVKNGNSGLTDIESKESTIANPERINPLLWFEREGDWVEPTTNFIMEYKARTSGFLFPETGYENGAAKYDIKDILNPGYNTLPYLNKFNQDRTELRNINGNYAYAGWSDWVKNGDSVGTANGKRIAYDYTDDNPDVKAKTMYISSAKFRFNTLNGYTFKNDENPEIRIYVNGSTTPQTVTKGNEVEIQNIQTMRIELAGKVRVRDNKGVENLEDFNKMYKVGYKIGTANEPYNWKNEWVGTNGINAECFEAKIQLSTAPTDDFSFATAPFIATQPEDVSAVIGTKAIFTTKAVGQNMTYQWYKINAADNGNMNKASAIAGATKYYYETANVTASDNGSTYYCIVTNGSGSTTTSQAILYAVDKLPEITANLSDITVENGKSYTCSVAATCQIVSDLKYQWEMTNANGEWQIVQATSTDNGYTFVASADTHNKYLRCKISNSRGHVYSNPARLSAVIAPTVKITASSTSANIGKEILFTSYVTSYGGVPTYSWYVKNLSDNTSSYTLQNCTDKTFEFSETTPGEYKVKCIVSDANGYSEDPKSINDSNQDASSVLVKVGNPPKMDSITYSLVKSGTVEEDIGMVNKYSGTFKANATITKCTGNNVRYEWYKNGKLISTTTANILKLEGLSENNQMTVMCKVIDMFGSSYKSIQFIVTPATNVTK